jgi:exodeoxyribonuclease VII large subunit
MRLRLAGEALRHAALHDRLGALDPRRVLARGYAWVSDPSGRAVTSAASVQRGDRLNTVWADGAAEVEVQHVLPAVRPQ